MRLPTIEDIEIYFDSEISFSDFFNINGYKYSDDGYNYYPENKQFHPEPSPRGRLLLVYNPKKNILEYYSPVDKKVFDKKDIMVQVKCIVK